jgi:hypothetical protein
MDLRPGRDATRTMVSVPTCIGWFGSRRATIVGAAGGGKLLSPRSLGRSSNLSSLKLQVPIS